RHLMAANGFVDGAGPLSGNQRRPSGRPACLQWQAGAHEENRRSAEASGSRLRRSRGVIPFAQKTAPVAERDRSLRANLRASGSISLAPLLIACWLFRGDIVLGRFAKNRKRTKLRTAIGSRKGTKAALSG